MIKLQELIERMIPSLSTLFMKIFRLGATAYGGPAMIGQIKQTVVNQYAWLKEEEFLQGMALCQLIPGATMVQMVTYVGYRLRGFWGALISAVAFIFPAFIALLILSMFYFKMETIPFIHALFKGLGAIVVAIVLNASITLGKPIIKDWKVILISVLSFFSFFFRLNILLIFVLAGVAAILLHPMGSQLKAPPLQKIKREGTNGRDYLLLGLLAILIFISLIFAYSIDPQLTSLCLRLSKIGALAFGGGFTMIPLIQYEVVNHFQWLSTKEFLDGIALGQITPGPIMITATFIGYKLSGFLGALMATIASFSPSFFILIFLIPYYDKLKGIEIVRTIERGILGSFIGMLGLVLYNFGKTAFVDIPSVIFAVAAFLALLKKVNLPYILLVGGFLSILVFGFLV
jgi:chromate transporter